ncbi:hypothetical protein AUJ10_01050 [Candidatus Pacearchaeota archaeon CG1_02_31_27]|nr:MAG: hypothetical protein AUJ10_01050 [Candidatus Pacearchaeota archaeon CG1_02_31_27]PIZ79862.1 MAG: hypothetical protein COX99_03540 [Candidatus Pacearchaeota archaeon CG_4_10_14_0_2_um_filter_31_10]
MGIFDIFRKKKEEPVEKITFDKLDYFVDKETKSLNEKSESFMEEIKKDAGQFSLKIKQKIPSLRLINLENRKEQEKLKAVVIENLLLYVGHLEKLLEELKKIEDKGTEDYINDLQLVFNDFNKKSRISFCRATILIGKEIEKVRDIMKNFMKVLDYKIKSRDIYGTFKKEKLIDNLRLELKKLEEAKNIQKQIEDSVKNSQNKISALELEKQSAETDYENYEKSNVHAEFLNEQEKIKNENNILAEDISRLKQELNLKLLSKYFHNDKKKNELLHNYSENFINSIKDDNNLKIISIAKEAKQSIDEQKIKELRDKIMNQKMLVKDKKLGEFENRINILEQEINEEKRNIEDENHKKQKFEKKEEEILIHVREDATKIFGRSAVEF